MLKIFWDIQVHPDAFVLDCMRMAAEKAVECEGILLPCAVSVCLCDIRLFVRRTTDLAQR